MSSEFATGRVIQTAGDIHPVSYGDDKSMYVEFYWRETEDPKKSGEAGRPIYVSKEYIRIIAPGDKTKKWDRPVRFKRDASTPSDLERFPRQWEAFKNQEKQVTEGTPVEEWSAITRSDAMSLKAINIYTVEQLASLGDNNLTWFGARSLRDKAKAWIEQAAKGVPAAQWAKDKADMQAQIQALTNQLSGFKEAGVQQASASPAKRGRPKKVNDEQDTSPVNTSGGE